MFVDEMRRAITAAPRERLASLASAVWKAYAGGAIGEGDAQALAEAVEARKAVPAIPIARRSVGSRPRSPESVERRRRWVASGLMPPQIAARFTMGEGAVLAVLAAECSKRGRCTLTIGHIAALAGVCRSTVKNAVRQAVALGLLKSDEWRLSAFRNAPNTVTLISREWLAWLRVGQRTIRGRVAVAKGCSQNRNQHANTSTELARKTANGERREWRKRNRKDWAKHPTEPIQLVYEFSRAELNAGSAGI